MVSGTFSIPLGMLSDESTSPARKRAALETSPSGLREFLAGEENQLARALLPALERRDAMFAPLVIYGSTGVGKTLLALGLLQHFKQCAPNEKTLVTTGADFARAYADALETDSLAAFRKKFTQAALVVFDDLHHLAEKPAAQEEWRRLLDALLDRRSLVIATCRQSPQELATFAADLCSRLGGGLVLPLVWPGSEVRREMIVRFLAARQASLPKEAVERLATEISGPPTRLFATLSHLLHTAKTDSRELNAALVAETLSEFAANCEATPRAIVTATAKQFQIKVSELKSASRRQSIAVARGVAMHLLRELRRMSFQEIGQLFSGRDHSTVMHACDKTRERIAADDAFAGVVSELKSQLLTGLT